MRIHGDSHYPSHLYDGVVLIMMNRNQQATEAFTSEGSRRVAIVMWFAAAASIVFLFAAGMVATDGAPATATPEQDDFLRMFPLAAVTLRALSGLSFAVMRARVPSSNNEHSVHTDKAALTRAIVAILISCALNQSVAVLGFVIALVTKDHSRSLPYCAAALAASCLIYPSRRQFEKFLKGRLTR